MPAPIGNKNASRGKMWREAIIKALDRRARIDGNIECKLERLADKLVDVALSGDLTALREIGDRLDGKPAQSVTVSGDEAQPLTIKGMVELVRPNVVPVP